MSRAADAVLEEALRLPESDRAEIAARLMASLDDGPDDDGAAWDAEIARRLGELDDGSVQPIAWTAARRKILDDDDAPGA